MKHKLALATAAALLFSCILGFINQNDPMSFIVSNNLVIILAKAASAIITYLAAVHLTSGRRALRLGLSAAGVAALAFCVVVFVSVPAMGSMYNYVRLLDLILLAEIGVILNLTALEMKVEPGHAPLGNWRLRIASRLQPMLMQQRGSSPAGKVVNYFTYVRSQYR